MFSRAVNTAGGEVLLDNRIRRGGSHHQKVVVVRRENQPADDIAFVGGMDLVHGRHDDARHLGDPQPADLDHGRYGERPGWHDVQVALRGPAVDDIAFTFRERWEDPSPLDHRNPLRWLLHRFSRHPAERDALTPERIDAPRPGPHTVQVLRTYPARRKTYPFAPEGERSIARAYIKAFGRARRLIYLEDQYLWSFHAARALRRVATRARAPGRDRHSPLPRPRRPHLGRRERPRARARPRRALRRRRRPGRDLRPRKRRRDGRLRAFQGVHRGRHLGRRRLRQPQPEIMDPRLRDLVRHPRRDATSANPATPPASATVPANSLATRAFAWQASTRAGWHVNEMIDPQDWFDTLRRSAEALDAWHRDGQRGPRPPGHLRAHSIERVNAAQHGLLHWVHAHVLDPDGRPSRLKRSDTF